MKSQLFCWTQIFLLSVLPLFKSFILTFKQKEPFWLQRSLVENFRAFLGCFMKFEVINNTPYSKLNLIDVASNVRKLKTLYVGDENEKLVPSLGKNKIQRDGNQFLQKASHCIYYCCSLYSKEIRIKQSSCLIFLYFRSTVTPIIFDAWKHFKFETIPWNFLIKWL